MDQVDERNIKPFGHKAQRCSTRAAGTADDLTLAAPYCRKAASGTSLMPDASFSASSKTESGASDGARRPSLPPAGQGRAERFAHRLRRDLVHHSWMILAGALVRDQAMAAKT